MQPPKITVEERYCNLMGEVRDRIDTIRGLASGKINAGFPVANIESMALHLRKIMEAIALGSLISHQTAYAQAYADFYKHWNANLILKDIKRIHPDFYPVPVKHTLIPGTPNRHHFDNGPATFGPKLFEKVYEKSAAILHVPNPFGRVPDYGWFERQAPKWAVAIESHMVWHTVKLMNGAGYYIVELRGADGKIHLYPATPLQET